jgi:hypothetical protein
MFLIVLNLWSSFVEDANGVLEAGQITYTRFASNDKEAWSINLELSNSPKYKAFPHASP